MIVIPALTPLLAAAGKQVAAWADSGSRLRVQAVSAVDSATCPDCGGRSARRHGLLWRTLADCPSFGLAVTLEVQVRRFKCANPACSRRTFSEPLEPLAGRRQRRTWRLRQQHVRVGYALGGEPGRGSPPSWACASAARRCLRRCARPAAKCRSASRASWASTTGR